MVDSWVDLWETLMAVMKVVLWDEISVGPKVNRLDCRLVEWMADQKG